MIFQNMNSVEIIKVYTIGCKDKGIRTFELVAKTQFLSLKKIFFYNNLNSM